MEKQLSSPPVEASALLMHHPLLGCLDLQGSEVSPSLLGPSLSTSPSSADTRCTCCLFPGQRENGGHWVDKQPGTQQSGRLGHFCTVGFQQQKSEPLKVRGFKHIKAKAGNKGYNVWRLAASDRKGNQAMWGPWEISGKSSHGPRPRPLVSTISVLTYSFEMSVHHTATRALTHAVGSSHPVSTEVFCPWSAQPPSQHPHPYSFKLWASSDLTLEGEKEQDRVEKEGEEDKKNDAPVLITLGLSQRKQDKRRTFRGTGSTLCHWSILIATQNLGQPFWSNVCDNTLWWSIWVAEPVRKVHGQAQFIEKKPWTCRENVPCSLFPFDGTGWTIPSLRKMLDMRLC